jgi:hypothetical protein
MASCCDALVWLCLATPQHRVGHDKCGIDDDAEINRAERQ